MTIGWGIIGIGDHADHVMAPVLNRSANTKLVAICSRSIARAQSFALKYGVDRAYDSFENMLEDPKLDVLYIATPNGLHAQQTIQAAEAGRHVLCEKPMALTVVDAELMIQACDQNEVKLGVCYTNRYHPAHIEAHRYIQDGAIGDIEVARVQYCRVFDMRGWRVDPGIAGAGTLMGQGIHCVDILRYLLDSEVTEVRAMTDEELPYRPVDEMMYAILRFENGAHGVVIAGVIAPRSDNDVILYGSEAKVTCRGTMGKQTGNLGELILDADSLNIRMTFSANEPLLAKGIRLVEDFNKWVESNDEPSITGYNGLQMVKITNAIIESSRTGRSIKISG